MSIPRSFADVPVELRPRSEWTLLGTFGVLATAGSFVTGDLLGVGAAAAFVLCWLVLPETYVYVLGHVFLVGVFPAPISIGLAVVTEVGLVSILIGSLLRLDGGDVTFWITVGLVAVLFSLVSITEYQTGTFWVPLVMASIVIALSSYVVHRYELLVTGLLQLEEEGRDSV